MYLPTKRNNANDDKNKTKRVLVLKWYNIIAKSVLCYVKFSYEKATLIPVHICFIGSCYE